MGFKDLQVLVLLVGLFLGHTFEVGAQTEAPNPAVPSPPSPSSWTEFQQWNVTGNASLETTITTILKSRSQTFSFDLLLTNQSKSSCAAIVRHTSFNTTVWVANFNVTNPNGQTNSSNSNMICFLHFTPDVGLVLNSSKYNEIWSTSSRESNLSRKGWFDTLELTDSGCLYIRNRAVRNSSVWTSFDYPADTLVKEQQLMPRTLMSAAQLNQEYSTGGIFYMEVDGASLTLEQDFKVSDTPRFIYWSLNANQSISHVEVNHGLSVYVNGNSTPLRSIPNANGSDWDYAKLESNGGLMLKKYDSETQLVNAGNCSLPAQCGSFGVCSLQEGCKCPEGFKQADLTTAFTCQRNQTLNTTTTNCSSDSKFVNITGLTYLRIPNDIKADDVNAAACETRCHGYCNCTNALHVRRNNSTDLGACYLNLDSMQTILQAVDNDPNYLQTLFLRIPGTGVLPLPFPPQPSGGGTPSRRTAASAFAGGAGALVLVLLAVSAWWLVHTRRKLFGNADPGPYGSATADMSPSLPPQYTFKELADSTSNFAQRLGYGGLSSVYAGNLPNTNIKLAVKNLDDNGHKDKEFVAAVATMGSLSHVNLVPLVGFCKEDKHEMLVYELVNEGRSLNWFLFNTHDSGPLIDASTRRSIALGTAQGLQHLHTAGVLHGGVKPENIMIDWTMQPMLVDYGLISLSTRFQRVTAANSRGSRAYMAPEWVKSGPIGEKADVYSLGVVILELVSGRRCLIPDATPEKKRFLPTWGFSMLGGGHGDLDSVVELVDPRLDIKVLSEIDQQVLKGMTFVALWCVQENPALRPSMEQVVRMLEGDLAGKTPPLSPALDVFGRELCASQQGGAQQVFVHSSSLSENSDMPPR